MKTIVWFRGKDLRLADHMPLLAAVAQGDVIPLFVLDPYFFAPRRAQELPHRMQFLLESLQELEKSIRRCGSQLVVVHGKSVEVLPQLAHEWRVDRVVAHRWVEPFGRERDRRIAAALKVPFQLYEGETLLAPGTLRTGSATPYARFTPFARTFWNAQKIGDALPPPVSLPPLPIDVSLEAVRIPNCRDLGIVHNLRLQHGGESAGMQRLRGFLTSAAANYDTNRDRMDRPGTSRLSADIKFGTVSVRTIWNVVRQSVGDTAAGRAYLNELIWREFTHSTLWDRPELLTTTFRADFADFPWGFDERLWQAWATGRTGYPIVDAASRQLLGEGFVHNRARMIHASFLTKHLLIHYEYGEAHYMKYLTDGDWAQNNAGWQWSAGCGCDAQPYFRVFNPITQGEKFDPHGEYVRRWIPELRDMPAEYCHAPWTAPPLIASSAGITIGNTYPRPIVDHKVARQRFLDLASKHLAARRQTGSSDSPPSL